MRRDEPMAAEVMAEAPLGSAFDAQLLDRVSDAVGWELYRLVVENSQDVISLVDLEGRIVFASGSWETVLGWRPKDVVGRRALDLAHPDDVQTASEAFAQSIEAGTASVAEIRVRRGDGGWTVMEGLETVIRDAEGRPALVLSTGRDVSRHRDQLSRMTARTEATRGLAESETIEEGLRRTLEAICRHLGWDLGQAWRADEGAGVLRFVAAWEAEQAGRFSGDDMGVTFAAGEGLPGRVWERGEAVWMEDVTTDPGFRRTPAAVRAGLRGAFAFPIRLGGGVLGVMELFSSQHRSPDEELLQTMRVIGSQVGQFMERKRAEEELLLQKSLLEAMTESATDGILVVDADGKMASFNRRFVQMWRIPDDVLASRSDEAALAAVRDQVVDYEGFRSRVEYLYERPDEHSQDEIPLRDGRVLRRYSAPVKVRGGRYLGRVWFFRDVTDRVRSERHLRLLVDVSEIVGWSWAGGFQQVSERVARLLVPDMADWCIVYLRTEDGRIERMALRHADPSKREFAAELQASLAIDPAAREGVPEVIRSGRSVLESRATLELLAADVVDRERLIRAAGDLEVRSWMCVPLSARGRTFGAVSFITAESGREYGGSDLVLAEEIARRVALGVDNLRLYRERDHIARTLQRSLLPPRLPDIPGAEIAGRYEPAGEMVDVGGDFYDVFEGSDGSWVLVIGDVCGKGADAAAVMAVTRYTVRALATGRRTPRGVLSAANTALLDQVEEGRFCTVCLVRVTRTVDGARAVVSCGGHPPPYVLRASGEVFRAGTPGTLLGVVPDPDVSDDEVELGPGDTLVLFTDGVLEGRAEGETDIADALGAAAGSDARTIVDRIVNLAERDGPGRHDDVAAVALRITGSS